MMGDEASYLALRWNNHNAIFARILSLLREQEIYTDVTLACDGKVYPAHRFVLSTCSDFFKTMFSSNACKHPVVYLKDVSSKDVELLLDFMYKGETKVLQHELSSLLRVAEGLLIKGLAIPDDLLSTPTETNSPESTAVSSHPEKPDGSTSHVLSINPVQKKRKRPLAKNTSVKKVSPATSNESSHEEVIPEYTEKLPSSDSQLTSLSNPCVDGTPSKEEVSLNGTKILGDKSDNMNVKVLSSPKEDKDTDGGWCGVVNSLGALDRSEMKENISEDESVASQRTKDDNNRVTNLAITLIKDEIDDDGYNDSSPAPLSIDYPDSGEDTKEISETVQLDHSQLLIRVQNGTISSLVNNEMDSEGNMEIEEDNKFTIANGASAVGGIPESCIVESPKKPFACVLCGHTFTRRDNLANHLKTHTGDRPFMCSYCYKCFSRKDYLRQHERIHTGERPYPCSLCGRAFTRKEGLTDHMRCHSDFKEFECETCGKCFKQKCGLRFHKRNYKH